MEPDPNRDTLIKMIVYNRDLDINEGNFRDKVIIILRNLAIKNILIMNLVPPILLETIKKVFIFSVYKNNTGYRTG